MAKYKKNRSSRQQPQEPEVESIPTIKGNFTLPKEIQDSPDLLKRYLNGRGINLWQDDLHNRTLNSVFSEENLRSLKKSFKENPQSREVQTFAYAAHYSLTDLALGSKAMVELCKLEPSSINKLDYQHDPQYRKFIDKIVQSEKDPSLRRSPEEVDFTLKSNIKELTALLGRSPEAIQEISAAYKRLFKDSVKRLSIIDPSQARAIRSSRFTLDDENIIGANPQSIKDIVPFLKRKVRKKVTVGKGSHDIWYYKPVVNNNGEMEFDAEGRPTLQKIRAKTIAEQASNIHKEWETYSNPLCKLMATTGTLLEAHAHSKGWLAPKGALTKRTLIQGHIGEKIETLNDKMVTLKTEMFKRNMFRRMPRIEDKDLDGVNINRPEQSQKGNEKSKEKERE